MYTRHSYNVSQLILLLQDTPKFSLLFRESFELTALLFFVTWIPLRIILALTEYPLIPSWFKYFTKVFKIPFDLPKILRSLLLLKFLLACIMVNPISLNLIGISCHYHFESVDSICLRIHAIIIDPYKLPFRLSCHSFNWNWFSTNPIVVDCTLRLFNLSIPNQSIAFDPLIWKS